MQRTKIKPESVENIVPSKSGAQQNLQECYSESLALADAEKLALSTIKQV